MDLNNNLVKSWFQLCRAGVRSIETLLQTSSESCGYCGGSVLSNRFNQEIQHLCARCYGQVQWINNIQCEICGRGERCDDCRRRLDAYFVASRSSVRYSEQIRPWLARFKYRGDERLKLMLTNMLERTFLQHYHHRTGALGINVDLLTYVPISSERLAERGFNQSQLLAEELGRRVRVPVEPLLIRTKHTGKQSYKSRAERLEDMKQAFDIRLDTQKRILTKSDFRPITILMIDDVYTTGSTLNQCAKVISTHLPAKLYGLTWAR